MKIWRMYLTLIGLVAIMVNGSPVAVAQEASPAAGADHPIVGSWRLDTDTANPTNPMTLAVFTSDGVYFQVEPLDGPGPGSSVGVGSWEPTGETTGDMTFVIVIGTSLTVVVRASIDSADGESLTATATSELIQPDGTSSGEMGPVFVEGTKISVEPQGTPAGSLGDMSGTPEATPAG